MCMCGKPTINGEPNAYSWDGKTFSTRKPDPPKIQDGETIVFDEPGRCGGLDSHCHHFRVVRHKYGGLALLVRNGGGDKRVNSISNHKAFEKALSALDSNGRYWILCALYHSQNEAASRAAEAEASRWRKAAADGRLKVRKNRGQDSHKVWIEPAD